MTTSTADLADQPATLTDRLTALRSNPRTRWLGFAIGAIVGLALASIHWVGLVVGGALVGLFARDLPRAVVAGLAFGVVALLAFAAWLALAGALGVYLEMGQILAVSVAIPLVGGALGSLVRGLV